MAPASGAASWELPHSERHSQELTMTDRQQQLYTALLTGKATKQLAYDMGTALTTLQEAASNLYRMFGVQCRTELMAQELERRSQQIQSLTLELEELRTYKARHRKYAQDHYARRKALSAAAKQMLAPDELNSITRKK